jgi:hypothetical protein
LSRAQVALAKSRGHNDTNPMTAAQFKCAAQSKPAGCCEPAGIICRCCQE